MAKSSESSDLLPDSLLTAGPVDSANLPPPVLRLGLHQEIPHSNSELGGWR